MAWIGALLLLVCLQIAAIVVMEFRRPSNAIAWIAIVYIFPFVGLILYYFVAQRFSHRRVMRREKRERYILDAIPLHEVSVSQDRGIIRKHQAKGYERLYRLLNTLPVTHAIAHNQVELMAESRHVFDAMMKAMEQAEDHIHVQFYTIRDDEIGRKFQAIWQRKASQGVKVRILYDGVGSWRLGKKYVSALQEAGVETACFLPPFVAFLDKRINYRNHRKIVIVDGKIGFMGGLNIGDEYLGHDPKLGYWRDTHLRIEGEAVRDLQRIFIEDWRLASGKNVHSPMLFPDISPSEQGGELVQLVAGGPDLHYEPILEVMFTAFSIAHERIWIATPYFIPDPSLFMALKAAAVCGVEVKLMIPALSDSKLVYYASQSYLQELLQAGVRVYRYERGFLHAKTILIDHVLVSVGTANLDMRSLYDNFELNALFSDPHLIDKLEEQFLADEKDCTELTLHKLERRSPVQRGLEAAARLLSPLL